MRRLALLALLITSPAAAQDEFEEPGADELGVPDAPSGYVPLASSWPSMPGGPDGVNDPIVETGADIGLVAAGAVMAGISYVIGASLSVFLGAIGCWGWCNPELATLGLLPVVHFMGGMGGGVGGWIAGGVFAPIELVGLIILLSGALANNRRLIEPNE